MVSETQILSTKDNLLQIYNIGERAINRLAENIQTSHHIQMEQEMNETSKEEEVIIRKNARRSNSNPALLVKLMKSKT